MNRTVSIDEMADAINEGLKEYATLASTEVKKAVRKSAKTVKDQISANAPSRTGAYKGSWVATKQSESSQSLQMVVHSKNRYQLAHLLEKGHAKRGGGRVEYNRAKLRGSMQLALRKRPVSSERIDAAVGAIEHKLSAMGEREVRSSKLGELVLEALRGMDTIAWIRFASVYLNINDPKAFAEMIEQALREAPAADEDAAGLETGEFYGVPETDESVEVADSPIELSDDSDPKGQLASSDPDGYIRKYR